MCMLTVRDCPTAAEKIFENVQHCSILFDKYTCCEATPIPRSSTATKGLREGS